MEISAEEYLQAADLEVQMRRWRDNSRPGKFKVGKVVSSFPFPPNVIRWWFWNYDNETYLLRHPAHKHLMWEKKVTGIGSTHIGWQRINGQMGAYRMRRDPLNLNPTDIKLENPNSAFLTTNIDTEGKPLSWILSEFKEVNGGSQITAYFIYPEATPDEFVEAHRHHALEENKFMAEQTIEYLIRRTIGYIPPYEDLMKYGVSPNTQSG